MMTNLEGNDSKDMSTNAPAKDWKSCLRTAQLRLNVHEFMNAQDLQEGAIIVAEGKVLGYTRL